MDVEEVRAIHSRYIEVVMQINDLDKRDEARPALMQEAKNLSMKLNLIDAGEVLLIAHDRLKEENKRLREQNAKMEAALGNAAWVFHKQGLDSEEQRIRAVLNEIKD